MSHGKATLNQQSIYFLISVLLANLTGIRLPHVEKQNNSSGKRSKRTGPACWQPFLCALAEGQKALGKGWIENQERLC